jgi:hypothetical protein
MTRSPYLSWLASPTAPGLPAGLHPGFGPDLVIGYATGYGPAELAPFVASLRAHSRAHVALVADARPETAAYLAANGIDRFDAPQGAGWTPHLLIARFKHYLPILAAYPQARRVLITDVRDVAFQGDPFAAGYPDDAAPIALFCETPPGTLGDHGANPRWLDTLIGPELAATLADRPVVCGGTIMGEPSALATLIRQLLMLCAIQRSGALLGIGADQAALNVIVHQGLGPAIAAANYGRVATIGYTAPPGVTDRGLTNPDGGLSPILHQYDRHPAAKAAIESRWRSSDLASFLPKKPKGLAKNLARWRKSFARRWPERR